MESAEQRQPKSSSSSSSSSKPSGIFHRFSKALKLAPAGTCGGHGGGRNLTFHAQNEDCSAEEIDCSKIHPQPMAETGDGGVVMVVHKLFDVISALKLSYIQFQQGHILYDHENIRSSGDRVLSHLESLSDIERVYAEMKKKMMKKNEGVETVTASLNAEVQEHRDLIGKLQAQSQSQETEMVRLKWEIADLNARNAELEYELLKMGSPEEEEEVSLELFKSVYEKTANAIHQFGKPLIALMKASGWDLKCVTDSIVASPVKYKETYHKKYTFEAYLSRKMFGRNNGGLNHKEGEEEEDVANVFDKLIKHDKAADPFEVLIENPDSNFARFCLAKYLSVVHWKMECSFFGNLDQRDFVSSGKHPRTPFYTAFVKMARWVWVLQVMADSGGAKMFYVRNGCDFRGEEMASVVKMEEEEEEKQARAVVVGFTVIPGFRIGNSLIPCKVYLSQLTRQVDN